MDIHVNTDFNAASGPSDRNFGFTISMALLLIAILGKYKYALNVNVIYLATCMACLLLLTSLIKAQLLKPFNILWMRLGNTLQKIVTPCIMFLVYITVFLPIGLILKLSGKATMLSYKTPANSYWIDKTKTDLADPMKYQF